MSLKDAATKKVPPRFQATREFKPFIAMLEQKGFTNTRALRMFLDSQMASCKAQLNLNKVSPRGNHHRLNCARQLGLYKAIKEKYLPYL